MVFQIELFQATGLIDFHAAVFTALAVGGLFADTQLTGSLADRLALRDQNLRLAQVTDNLFRGITISGHDDPFLMTQFLTPELGTIQGGRSEEQITEIVGGPLGHAEATETSMMLAIRPELVNVSEAGPTPADLWGDNFPFPSLKREGSYTIPTLESVPDGFYGSDVTLASAEKGEKILDVLAGSVAEVVQEMASAPTPAEYKHVWRRPLPEE